MTPHNSAERYLRACNAGVNPMDETPAASEARADQAQPEFDSLGLIMIAGALGSLFGTAAVIRASVASWASALVIGGTVLVLAAAMGWLAIRVARSVMGVR